MVKEPNFNNWNGFIHTSTKQTYKKKQLCHVSNIKEMKIKINISITSILHYQMQKQWEVRILIKKKKFKQNRTQILYFEKKKLTVT